MPAENFRQELNRLASEKGYFLQDCCTLLFADTQIR